jgi:DNA-binding CsgD family transcriptional regulator
LAQAVFKIAHRRGKYEEVKALLFERLPQRAMADRLGLKHSGVQHHIANILKEYGVKTRDEYIALAAFKHYSTIINQLKEELEILKAKPDTKIEYVYKTVEVVKEVKVPTFTLPIGVNHTLT